MMHPTPRAVWLLGAGLLVALAPAVLDAALWPMWAAYVAGAAALVLAEAFLLVPPGRLQLRNRVPPRIFIGSTETWRVRAELAAGRGVELEVGCELDPELAPQPPQTIELAAGAPRQIAFELRPRRRGTLAVEALWLRWRGPFGLLALTRRVAVDAAVAVVPDTGTVRATALRFFSSSSAFLGLKTERYVGDGSEFDALRAYVPGLDTRSIDWKASARHRRLVCRRFRAERNHQIILAIDTGHLMSEPLGGLPRLDHAINRALLLGYFCLRTGDRVGMFTFGAEPGAFVEPQGGLRSFDQLQQRTAAIAYGTGETNFTLAMLALSARLRRRSLIVVFSEFVDTVTAELMIDNLDRLARRHLIVFVALRDPELERIEHGRLRRLGDLHRAVVAADLARERELVFERLRRSGVHLVDARPDAVATDLLNRYFEIKRRELV